MNDSIEILKILENEPCTLSKIYDNTLLTKSTVRGRLYELRQKHYIKKLYGKFNITPEGILELERTVTICYNYIVYNTINKTHTNIYAETRSKAETLAKVIYGTNYKVDNIGTR